MKFIPKLKDGINLIADKGYTVNAPDNSTPAFESAGLMKYNGVEFDVMTTADGVWVVSAENDIAGFTDGTGFISELTYDEIYQYSFTGDKAIKYDSYLKVLTLNEVLHICELNSMDAYINIKSYKDGQLKTLTEIIENTGVDCIIESMNYDCLTEIKNIDGNIKLSLICNKADNDIIERCKNDDIGLILNYGNVSNLAKIHSIKKQDVDLCVFNVNGLIETEICKILGIENIITNRITY